MVINLCNDTGVNDVLRNRLAGSSCEIDGEGSQNIDLRKAAACPVEGRGKGHMNAPTRLKRCPGGGWKTISDGWWTRNMQLVLKTHGESGGNGRRISRATKRLMACDVGNVKGGRFEANARRIPGVPAVERHLRPFCEAFCRETSGKRKIWKRQANRLFCVDRNDRKVSSFCVDRKAEHTWNSKISVV